MMLLVHTIRLKKTSGVAHLKNEHFNNYNFCIAFQLEPNQNTTITVNG